MSLQVANVVDCQLEATVETVLAALDRWTARNDGHHTEKRVARRFALRTPVIITTRHPATGTAFRVEAHSRNISVSGLAFVVPKRIRAAESAVDVLVTSLLTLDSLIRISVDREGRDLRLVARICRLRKVHDNLYECGVRFVGRDEGSAPGDRLLEERPAPVT